jgi:cell division protein ZapE
VTILQEYQRLLDTDALTPDLGQEHAAARLDALASALEPKRADRSGEAGSGGGLLGMLGFRKAPPPAISVPGLYLYGPVGRGKSMLMDMFHDLVPVASKRRAHFHEFMQEAHGLIHRYRTTGSGGDTPIVQAADQIASETRLLCFDEMEVRDIADAMVLARLFTRLFERGVVVVATSNRHPDDLYRNGLHRDRFLPFIALLKEKVEIVDLGDGKDYRRDRLVGSEVYFTPIGRAAREKVDAVFDALTDGAEPERETVVVNAREVVVPKAAKQVARFRFDEICGTTLGAADYLAVAKRYRAVVIDGVPKMTDDIVDKARRFITLIDILYEQRCHFICSAEVSAEALYDGVDWGFEFDRTVSRLMEMRSATYLQALHKT